MVLSPVKVHQKIVCPLFIILLEVISGASFLEGQTKTMVVLSPSSLKIRPSLTAQFDIQAVDFKNLFAASVTVQFDSTILRYQAIIHGSFLTGSNTNSVFLGIVPQPPLPAVPNQVTVDQAIWGGRTVSGTGLLFSIAFKALRAGSSPVTIASYEFRNGQNEYILPHIESGKIIVNTIPQPSQLLSPPDGSLIDTSLRASLVWSRSIDGDPGDNIRYSMCLMNSSSSIRFDDITDTTFEVTKDMLQEDCEYSWYIVVTDGIDTTSSRQTFKFKTPIISLHKDYPCVFHLDQNYPNPFNQLTNIRFSVSLSTQLDVTIFDIAGHEIIRLLHNAVNAGWSTITWDGKNSNGIRLGSGIYFCKVTAGELSDVKKMVLLK